MALRAKLRGRSLLPVLVVVGVAVGGLLTAGASAQSSSAQSSSAQSSSAQSSTGGSTASAYGTSGASTSGSQALRPTSAITYHLPPASYIPAGLALFQANCASCHGSDAYGTDRAPNLVGLGAATVDLWVSSGRMPLAASAIQAERKPPRFDRKQTLEIVAYVASLAPASINGPAIPTVDLEHADLADGNTLFVLNCAACHTITGAGDAIARGYFAPSLHKANARQAVEAMRTGPGNMPCFSPGTLTDKQVADIVATSPDRSSTPTTPAARVSVASGRWPRGSWPCSSEWED